MASFFGANGELVNFSQIGEIKQYASDLRIVYICKGGRKIDVTYDSQADYDNALDEIADAGGGGGGGGTAPKFTGTATVSVGGINEGDVFNSATMQTMFSKLISPDTDPVLDLTLDSTGPFAIGTAQHIKATAVITKGTKKVCKLIITANGTKILEETGTNILGTYEVEGDYTATTNFLASVYDRNDKLILSDAAKITFEEPVYYGVINTDTPTETDILALNMGVIINGRFEYKNVDMTNERVCYCQDSALGGLTSIKDIHEFELLDAFTKKVITVNGTDYDCYIETDTGTLEDGEFDFIKE